MSHVQLTGQGMAMSLYTSLQKPCNDHNKKVFLDVQAKFELHALTDIVKNCKLFVFIEYKTSGDLNFIITSNDLLPPPENTMYA